MNYWGIISQSDILLAESDFEQIYTFMKNKLITISQYKNIGDAAKLMKSHHIHHVKGKVQWIKTLI